MSHQVSQQKAGEGILLQLETNKDCCPFCFSAKGIYTEDRLTDVFPMQDNNVVSCYFQCNLLDGGQINGMFTYRHLLQRSC